MLKKNLFTINPRYSFLDSLASGILDRYGSDPLSLSKILVLLPNRRSCRNLQECLVRNSKTGALLLPQIKAIGDVDELDGQFLGSDSYKQINPAIGKYERLLLLADYIKKKKGLDFDRAMKFADDLINLLDEVQREEVELSNVEKMVPDELSEYWNETLDFLLVLSDDWPSLLKERKQADIVERRNLLIRLQSEIWQKEAPEQPIIAAGSTGSIPSTASFLSVVASLPNGQLILPGIDKEMPQEQWDAIEESHPQFGLKNLIENIGANRDEIEEWTHMYEPSSANAREIFVRNNFIPQKYSNEWRNLDLNSDATEGISLIEATDMVQESTIIAMMLRKEIEDKDKRAVLVTHEAKLAQRVKVLMNIWGIEIDSSAGISLPQTAMGSFFLLVAEAVRSRFSAINLMAILKNKFSKNSDKKWVLELEKNILCGPRISGGLEKLAEIALENDMQEAADEINKIIKMSEKMSSLFSMRSIALGELLEEHIKFAQFISGKEQNEIWNMSDEGEVIFNFFTNSIEASKSLSIDPGEYISVLKSLMGKEEYRPAYGTHPRLSILTPIEARLQHYDLVILGGMNKGSWPSNIEQGWIANFVRESIDLPPLERSYGLAAHDMFNFLHAGKVVLTRSQHVDGTGCIPSPWWERVSTVAEIIGADLYSEQKKWIDWADQFIGTEVRVEPVQPEPTPPLDSRPRELSVTQIEKLMRDPYSVYANKILKLKPLDMIDEVPDMSIFGQIVHDAIDSFVSGDKNKSFDDLILCGQEEFLKWADRPIVTSLWWPRFEFIADWFIKEHQKRIAEGAEIYSEIEGKYSWQSAAGKFSLTARADRIEIYPDGTAIIIDYKTGVIPRKPDVEQGFSPQLTLEALMLEKEAFMDIKAKVEKIEFWGLKSSGKCEILSLEHDQQATDKGLKELIEFFDQETTAYLSCPNPDKVPKYNDYAHLARVKEWSN